MTDKKKAIYKAVKEAAKTAHIQSKSELHYLISDKFYDDDITGADYEILCSQLKLR